MSALLCCGHIFYTPHLQDEGIIYKWLDLLLTSKDEKVKRRPLIPSLEPQLTLKSLP